MGVKYFKLTGYKPFWIYADGKVPRSHINQILQNVSLNNIRSLLKVKELSNAMSNDEHWIETTNYERANIWKVTGTGTEEDIADYLKVSIGGHDYFYYLINKTESIKATTGDIPYYEAEYELDEYMTVFWDKLEILRGHNPRVKVKFGFNNRWDERKDENGNLIGYVIDYINQRWISNNLADTNDLMVREFAYDTTASDIYSLNFPSTVIPTTYNVVRYDTGADAITLSDFVNKLTTPNARGRYEYIVAKSSSKMKVANDELLNSHTDDQFVLIPLFADNRAEILHGLNDFDTTATGDGFLVPFGDNEMGIWECDIPYSIFWGWVANNQYGGTMKYAHQRMGNDTYINIPFFTFDNNAPFLLKIIDFATYRNGFYGIFYNMITNIYLWTPETEPAMYAPNYYAETYNNGEAELTIDAAKFVFNWNNQEINQFGVEAYLSLSSDLVIAYNFGANSNDKLATLDNTQTVLGKGSIKNMYIGSNSSNYFTTNAATNSTSVKNRQSQQTQAWIDAGLNSAKAALEVVPNNIKQALNPFHYAKAGARAALNISQIMTDTAMEQQRANREFNASLNNITTSPSQTLSDPSVKASIPNRKGLFETWARRLHPELRVNRFNDYIHNGYPIDAVMYLNDVLTNRQFMNVLNLDTTKYEDDLMKILTENDTSIFNTKFWNKRFLAWLNSANNIYNTTRLVNVTDYEGPEYLSNIETEPPDIPVPKDDIARFIKNFRTEYEARRDFILEALMEDNPDAPENIWEQITIKSLQFGGFIIEALTDADADYYGNIVVQATCYNGYIVETINDIEEQIKALDVKKDRVMLQRAKNRLAIAKKVNDEIRHYFWNVDFLCNTNYRANGYGVTTADPVSWTIVCPDGTQFSNIAFNSEIVWNEKIENTTIIDIPNGFLNGCYAFIKDIEIPEYINSVGTYFMYDCSINNNGVTERSDLIDTYEQSGSVAKSRLHYYDLPATNIYINCDPNKFKDSNYTCAYSITTSPSASALVYATSGLFIYKRNFTKNFKNILGTYAEEFKTKFTETYIHITRDSDETRLLYYDSSKTQPILQYSRKYAE